MFFSDGINQASDDACRVVKGSILDYKMFTFGFGEGNDDEVME